MKGYDLPIIIFFAFMNLKLKIFYRELKHSIIVTKTL